MEILEPAILMMQIKKVLNVVLLQGIIVMDSKKTHKVVLNVALVWQVLIIQDRKMV